MKTSGRLNGASEVCDRTDDSVIGSRCLFAASQRRVGQHL